jgi:transglutaminase-like putative cysteine protease
VRYLIEHETLLRFRQPVHEHQIELRLAPREDSSQKVEFLQIDVEPRAELHSYLDSFGNRVHAFSILSPHLSLATRLNARVETLLKNPFDFLSLPSSEEKPWIERRLKEEPRLWDFILHRSPYTPDLVLLDPVINLPRYDPSRNLVDCLREAMESIHSLLRYESGVTQVHSPLQEVLSARAGVCQDFAHLLIAVVRSWGFPARYVVGYQDPGEASEEEARLPQATHAWAEVLIPGTGWRGFDATHRLLINDHYVSVAVGRDSLDAAPQRGSFKGPDDGKIPEVQLKVARQQ